MLVPQPTKRRLARSVMATESTNGSPVQFTKESGETTRRMAKGLSGTAVVTSISVNSKWIRRTVLESTSMQTGHDMKVNGIAMFKRDRVRRFGLTAPSTLAITSAA